MSRIEFEHSQIITIESGKDRDVVPITKLQQKYLETNVSEPEKTQHGFLTLETSPETIAACVRENAVFVVHVNNQFAGYVLTMSPDLGNKISLFTPLIERVPTFTFQGKKVSKYNWCIIAQDCIDEQFRGLGLARRLFSAVIDSLRRRHEIGIGEIRQEHPFSLAVHQKLGFTCVGSYTHNSLIWNVVILGLRR